MENSAAKVKMIPKVQMPGSESLLTAVNNWCLDLIQNSFVVIKINVAG